VTQGANEDVKMIIRDTPTRPHSGTCSTHNFERGPDGDEDSDIITAKKSNGICKLVVRVGCVFVCACVFYLWLCPTCKVYTWSSELVSQWIDHVTCEVSRAYSIHDVKNDGK
jgi:hypothetical protein